MSDMHGACSEVVQKFIRNGTIDKDTVVICTGDMGGADGKLGGLLDPTEQYQTIRAACKAFYFVQGNHDVNQGKIHRDWLNDDGTICYLHRRCVDTCLGRMGGVSGITIRDKEKEDPECHKYLPETYERFLHKEVMQNRPSIVLTHMPPKKSLGVKLHLFGHAAPPADGSRIGGTPESTTVNMDNAIFIWERRESRDHAVSKIASGSNVSS